MKYSKNLSTFVVIAGIFAILFVAGGLQGQISYGEFAAVVSREESGEDDDLEQDFEEMIQYQAEIAKEEALEAQGVPSAATTMALPESPQTPENIVVDNETPNIVVIVNDDLPALDGRLFNFMPITKDIFVNHGITFSDFHSSNPVCCPGRASLLSGQHSHNHGQTSNTGMKFDATIALPKRLDDIGYHTILVGKYLNPYGSKCSGPFKIYCWPNKPTGYDEWAAVKEREYYTYDMVVWNESLASTTIEHYGSAPEDYSTDVFAQKAVNYIQNAPTSTPLFLWVAPYAPHAPTLAAPRYTGTNCKPTKWKPASWHEADVSDKPLWIRLKANTSTGNGKDLAKICKSMLAVDDLVGNVRDALIQTGRLDNTIFIFTSDNSMLNGEHGLEQKGIPHNTLVPFIISWPQQYGTVARTITERVQNYDLAPTLCEIVGCTMPDPDGLSFKALLDGTATSLGRDVVLDEAPKKNSYIPIWYAVTTTSVSPLASEGCAAASTGGCKWHYIEYPTTGEKELYDISNGPCWAWSVGQPGDPCELDNQINNPAYASIISTLHTRLEQLKAE